MKCKVDSCKSCAVEAELCPDHFVGWSLWLSADKNRLIERSHRGPVWAIMEWLKTINVSAAEKHIAEGSCEACNRDDCNECVMNPCRCRHYGHPPRPVLTGADKDTYESPDVPLTRALLGLADRFRGRKLTEVEYHFTNLHFHLLAGGELPKQWTHDRKGPTFDEEAAIDLAAHLGGGSPDLANNFPFYRLARLAIEWFRSRS